MRDSHGKHKVSLLFIGGTGRSGTTIVGDLLDAHHAIIKSSPTELKFISNPQGLLDVIFGARTYPEKTERQVSRAHVRTYRRHRAKKIERFNIAYLKLSERFWSQWWQIDAPEPHGPGISAGYSRAFIEAALLKFKRGAANPIKAGRKLIDHLVS